MQGYAGQLRDLIARLGDLWAAAQDLLKSLPQSDEHKSGPSAAAPHVRRSRSRSRRPRSHRARERPVAVVAPAASGGEQSEAREAADLRGVEEADVEDAPDLFDDDAVFDSSVAYAVKQDMFRDSPSSATRRQTRLAQLATSRVFTESDCRICALEREDGRTLYRMQCCDTVVHHYCIYRCLASRCMDKRCVACMAEVGAEETRKILERQRAEERLARKARSAERKHERQRERSSERDTKRPHVAASPDATQSLDEAAAGGGASVPSGLGAAGAIAAPQPPSQDAASADT